MRTHTMLGALVLAVVSFGALHALTPADPPPRISKVVKEFAATQYEARALYFVTANDLKATLAGEYRYAATPALGSMPPEGRVIGFTADVLIRQTTGPPI